LSGKGKGEEENGIQWRNNWSPRGGTHRTEFGTERKRDWRPR
jgi:hypothetical protein